MLFRRRSAAARRKVSRAVAAVIDPLERRQLLTALVNGKFRGTGTPFDGTNVYEYRQGANQSVRITVSGNLSAEFIGGFVSSRGTVSLTDLPVAGTTTADNPLQIYLFSIYVSKSDANSVITIADVPAPTAQVRKDAPFDGGPTIRVINASSGASQVINSGVGGVYIGAETRTDIQAPGNNIPAISARQRAFGLRPSSAGELFAGLEIAPGNDFGKFLLGGTITGLVDISGSIDTFYAGNVLTGDAGGVLAGLRGNQGSLTPADFPNRNFYVGGNISHLLSGQSFGTQTLVGPDNLEQIVYKTGFELAVHGNVGEMESLDSTLAEIVVQNSKAQRGNGEAQTEIEYRGITLPANSDATYFDTRFFGFDVSIAASNPTADSAYNSNDTFDTAQYLGSQYSTDLNSDEVIQLNGSLGNNGSQQNAADSADYYAVALLAGQSMTVQVTDPYTGLDTGFHARVGIFDPNDLLISSDYSNIDTNARVGNTITITAKVAGAYRIAVANNGDTNFNGTVDAGEGVSSIVPDPYELRVTQIGDVALGGLIAGANIAFDDLASTSLEVDRGDVGEVQAGLVGGGVLWDFGSNPWYVPAGNLRAIEASQIGILRTGRVQGQTGIDLQVLRGTLGLVRTTDAAGALAIDDDTLLFPTSGSNLRLTDKRLAIGDGIQLIDAAGDFSGDLLSDGGIGVVRATTIGLYISLPVIQANVDNSGNDGTIDLIDVLGDGIAGSVDLIGAAITTGPGGDVRFIRLNGNATAARDPSFGGGQPEATVYAPGVSASITDDSGALITIRPVNEYRSRSTTRYVTSTGTVSLLTYPIRFGGGNVIINATITPGAPVTTIDPLTGVAVTTASTAGVIVSANNSSRAEISTLTINGSNGPAFTFDPITRVYTPTLGTQAAPNDDIIFTGSAKMDVFELATDGGTITNLLNQTGGEIDNITGAPNILNFEAASIGESVSSTGEEVTGFQTQNPGYPFAFPGGFQGTIRIGNLVTVGDVNLLSSQMGIGNVLANNLNVVRANSDGRNAKGVFDGIAGPIVSQFRGAAINTEGNIVNVSIGEGIASSGTGLVGLSGLYADGTIDRVAGSTDIRGDIIAADGAPPTTTTTTDIFGRITTLSSPLFAIGTIALSGGGSIVDADILTTSTGVNGNATVDATAGQEGRFGGQLISQGDTFGTEIPDITSIIVSGTGGIIGAEIAAEDVGPISVSGFGVLNSGIFTAGPGTVAGITAAGYGIRDVLFQGGAKIGRVVATGNGKVVPVTAYSASVRTSESGRKADGSSGQQLDRSNDLDEFLGTTKSRPKIAGVTDTGIIEDTTIESGRSLDLLQAYAIRARRTTTTLVKGQPTPILLGEVAFPMRVFVADQVTAINVKSTIDGLDFVSGGLGTLTTGSDISNAQFNITGAAGTFDIGGSLRGSATINVVGTEGSLSSITTKRSLYGTLNVSQDIKNISVGTDFGSALVSTSHSIRNITINGSILSGGFLRAKKTIFVLNIGKNLETGGTIQAHSIQEQNIKGVTRGRVLLV